MDNFKGNNRNLNLDIIRTIAIFTVFSIHFLLKSGYFQLENVSGIDLYIPSFIQTCSFVCIPLFLLLSGYLMNEKEISFKYYFVGIKKIIVIYLICSVMCLIFDAWYTKNLSVLKYGIYNIFNYSASHYAWYVNMYLGLYLIIPFLNICYKALKTRNRKLLIIFILIIINSLPESTNQIVYLFPDYWTITYPITYYFIGSFLFEYNIKFRSKIKGLLLLLSGIVVDWFYTVYLYKKLGPNDHSYFDLTSTFISVVLFIMINSIEFKNNYRVLGKIVASVSKMSFAMYLISYIVDKYIYGVIYKTDFTFSEKLKYYFIAIPMVAIISYILSLIVYVLYNLFIKIDKPISDKVNPVIALKISRLNEKLNSKEEILAEKT